MKSILLMAFRLFFALVFVCVCLIVAYPSVSHAASSKHIKASSRNNSVVSQGVANGNGHSNNGSGHSNNVNGHSNNGGSGVVVGIGHIGKSGRKH